MGPVLPTLDSSTLESNANKQGNGNSKVTLPTCSILKYLHTRILYSMYEDTRALGLIISEYTSGLITEYNRFF